MTDVFIFMGGSCLVLVVVCLIVREQTGARIRQLRLQGMGLRNEERRFADRRSQLEHMHAELREVLLRTERQETVLDQEFSAADAKLEELHQRVRGESPSGAVKADQEADGD